MKSLSVAASMSALAGGVTADQLLVILGAIITIINIIMEVIKALKKEKEKDG